MLFLTEVITMNTATVITVQTLVNQPIDKVWSDWTDPVHVKNWNNASPDWRTPSARNDLRIGGSFVYRMEAKDGSTGFDFGGEYTNIVLNRLIEYKLKDGRKVSVEFIQNKDDVSIVLFVICLLFWHNVF